MRQCCDGHHTCLYSFEINSTKMLSQNKPHAHGKFIVNHVVCGWLARDPYRLFYCSRHFRALYVVKNNFSLN